MNRRNAVRTLLSAAGVAALSGCSGQGLQGFKFQSPRLTGRLGGDNKPLSLEVHQALLNDAQTNRLLIEVFTNDEGIVILKGRAPDSLVREAAERVAYEVDGVTRVDNILFISDFI